MKIPSPSRSFVGAIAITTLFACGGASESDHATQGSAGATTTTNGGSLGKGGATGQGGNTNTGGICCNSRAHCYAGDVELSTGAACPANTTCYVQPAVCCSPSINCARGVGGTAAGGAGVGGSGATGNVAAASALGGASSGGSGATGNVASATAAGGISAGGAGGAGATGNVGATTGLGGWSWDTPTAPVGGACSAPSCAAGYSFGSSCTTSTPNPCYSSDDCGGQMICQKTGVTCDRTSEYNRRYQLADTTQCQTAAISCITNTTVFKNACGCGCEQSSSCTEWIDCMPGSGTISALCSDSTVCPFSGRAY